MGFVHRGGRIFRLHHPALGRGGIGGPAAGAGPSAWPPV
jgi:hypothetical protein